ncbi:hypothetical protein ACJMK2_030456 [Sinanodonta woodiana]|uniref:Uncharacterized protein n=1 Tax=Sinanodonta woodiana TaxID=1069815 RepID=A0ABD3XFM5_SINWO
MCTVGSVTGFPILLTTSYASVDRCVCTIEASSGRFVIFYVGQPTSPDCGTSIDITNNSGIISTTFQCQQPQLYESVGYLIMSGEISFHKQSNSTEDDINYCLVFTGYPVTISCYGTDSQPPTPATTTKETTSTTTVRTSTTTSTSAVPTTTGIIATPVITTTQQPPSESIATSSSSTSEHTTLLTSSTTNHQVNNADLNNANKTQRKDERNDSYADLSNDREGNSEYETLNNMQIISVSVVKVIYENVAP